jgi:SNF2 family DNA or RNA helicase
MAVAALLLEDNEVDIVLLIAEANKITETEWQRDLSVNTSIDWVAYAGSPAKRAKIRQKLPQLLLASYDVVKRDAAIFRKNERGNEMAPVPGPLIEALEGKRVLVICDETTRIANRGSQTYKAHQLLFSTLRDTPGFRLLAMTATPMEKTPENYFNLCRLLYPQGACTVEEFERSYVLQFDVYRNPFKFKNLSPGTTEPGVTPLNERLAPIVLRKRKSDPDVVNFFPKKFELPPTFVKLGKSHLEFYKAVAALTDGLSDWEARPFVTVLRQLAAHPLSLSRADGELAQAITNQVTVEGLQQLGSAKTDRMMDWCREVVQDQGAQAVIFTFFAHSVLPLLSQSLESAGYSVSIHHGGMSATARSAAQRAFQQGDTQIFLTSDAGQRGINLPTASYLLNYERPPSHTNFIQRSDRIHRVDSTNESVFIYSLVAQSTIEEGFYELGLRRNSWSDKLLEDDLVESSDFLSATDRRYLLRVGRKQAK